MGCLCCTGSSVSFLKEQCFSNTHVLKNLTILFVAVRVSMSVSKPKSLLWKAL